MAKIKLILFFPRKGYRGKGFRPYHDLINTLLHELTHNVHGDHDVHFKNLNSALKKEYSALRAAGGGQTTGDAAMSSSDIEGTSSEDVGHELGGAAPLQDARAAAAAAAMARASAAAEIQCADCVDEPGSEVLPPNTDAEARA